MDSIFFVSEAVATTPTNGYVMTNCWWAVHPSKGIAFQGSAKDPRPQCNLDRGLSKNIPGCILKRIPPVFLRHANLTTNHEHP